MKRKIVAGVLVLLTMLILVVSIQPVSIEPTKKPQSGKAQFVIASWDYPDAYGQGIDSIYIAHNITGSWVDFPESPLYSTDSATFELTAGESVRLKVYCYLNRSFIGLPEPWNQGHKYIRHSVEVANFSDVVFSQQNFTYDAFGGTADQVEWYRHTIILDFLADWGQIYTATITYEIWW